MKLKIVTCLILLFLIGNTYVFAQETGYYIEEIRIENVNIDNVQLEGIVIKNATLNKDLVNKINSNKPEKRDSFFQKMMESKLTPPILSALISATITISLFLIGRKIAKNQVIFDIALKNLLPSVYMPLINELRNYDYKHESIDFRKIENVIIENAALINFAPKTTREKLYTLYSECKKITGEITYKDNEKKLVEKLKELEEEINKRFGALLG